MHFIGSRFCFEFRGFCLWWHPKEAPEVADAMIKADRGASDITGSPSMHFPSFHDGQASDPSHEEIQ
jgi:hypothetical protein